MNGLFLPKGCRNSAPRIHPFLAVQPSSSLALTCLGVSWTSPGPADPGEVIRLSNYIQLEFSSLCPTAHSSHLLFFCIHAGDQLFKGLWWWHFGFWAQYSACEVRGFPSKPAGNTQDTSWVSCKSTHDLPEDSIRPTRPWLLVQVVTSVSDWLAINLSFPTTPSLGLINFLEQLTELRKPTYSLDYQFIAKNIKGCKSTARWRDTQQGLEQRSSVLVKLELVQWQVETLWFPNLEALQILSFWVFMEPSSHRHAWLNHWPLVIERNLQPLSPPWKSGGELKAPLFMVSSPSNKLPSLGAFLKAPH